MHSKEIIILYDDNCDFCNWCRAFVEKRTAHNDLRFVGMKNEESLKLVAQHKLVVDSNTPDTIVTITHTGAILYKWRACLEIGKYLCIPYRQLSLIMTFLPTLFGNWIYDFVSRNRGALCKIMRCNK